MSLVSSLSLPPTSRPISIQPTRHSSGTRPALDTQTIVSVLGLLIILSTHKTSKETFNFTALLEMANRVVFVAALVAGRTLAQSSITSQTVTSATGSTASSTDTSYVDPLIQSLWGEAGSLISSYYPSTTISNVAALTIPGTAVGGSSTITPSSSVIPTTLSTSSLQNAVSTPTTTSSASNSTSASSSHGTDSDQSDKRLGIGLGVGLGSVALGLLIFLVWMMNRRKRRAGKFTKGHPSASESEIQSWRAPSSRSSQFPEKYTTLEAPHPPVPPMATHLAPTDHWANSNENSSSEENPFYSPYESYAELAAQNSRQHSITSLHELHGESSTHMLNDRPASPITRAAISAVGGRPLTPYTPMEMQSPISPISPAEETQHHGFWRNPRDYVNLVDQPSSSDAYDSGRTSLHHSSNPTNPFLSEEDDTFGAPPAIPDRSERRRSSPVVHYPSGNELSTFDFGISGSRRRWADEEQAAGDDGWRGPASRRESVIGRHELQ